MKIYIYTNLRFILLLGLGFVAFSSCERDFSDEVKFATFSANADIFTDTPVSLTDEFFVSFDPAIGANTEGFGTDDDIAFEGSSSIRIDVPAPDDPNGSFIGGIFLDRGPGRDLTGFDALTFYVKGSTTATIDEVGFGSDFEEDKFAVGLQNIRLSTDWKKVIIPIPDPSKLIQERGMFRFSAGTLSTNGVGFTFWIDELRFESLGTVAQSRPSILGGNDSRFPTTVGQTVTISQLQQTFNLGSGVDQTINLTPSYFSFESSDPNVAFVDELGEVTVVGTGSTEITASIAGVLAEGKLLVESSESAQIVSIFTDLFADLPVDNYNGFFLGQNTKGGLVEENGGQIIRYTELDFVSINFFQNVAPIDITEMTELRISIRVDESIDAGDFINIQLINSVGNPDLTSGTFRIEGSDLVPNEWVEFQIPLSNFTGLGARNAIGQLFFVSDGTISNVSIDNIFFSAE